MIYFIQNTKTKAIKIGYTQGDPEKRLKTLQTGSSHQLNLLAVFQGDLLLERSLHYQFRGYHLRGEWFEPGPDLIDALLERKPRLEILTEEEVEVVPSTVHVDLPDNRPILMLGIVTVGNVLGAVAAILQNGLAK